MRTNGPTRGFSLVEVVIGLLILGVALVGLAQGVVTALGSTKESELQTTAALIAAGQIEQLRADGALTDGETESDELAGLPMYHWKQTISPASVDGLHEVVVAVENSRTGVAIYELRTLLFAVPADSTPNDTNTRGGSRQSRSQRRRSG